MNSTLLKNLNNIHLVSLHFYILQEELDIFDDKSDNDDKCDIDDVPRQKMLYDMIFFIFVHDERLDIIISEVHI
jgi:hypothetical protein